MLPKQIDASSGDIVAREEKGLALVQADFDAVRSSRESFLPLREPAAPQHAFHMFSWMHG